MRVKSKNGVTLCHKFKVIQENCVRKVRPCVGEEKEQGEGVTGTFTCTHRVYKHMNTLTHTSTH